MSWAPRVARERAMDAPMPDVPPYTDFGVRPRSFFQEMVAW